MKVHFLLCLLAFGCSRLLAQGVKISSNPGNPDASAVLDAEASNKGVLVPRVDLQNATDGLTVANPATGLLVFNTGFSLTPAGFYYNAGTPQNPAWALVLPNPANTDLDMSNFNIVNLAPPVNPNDAANKDYVDQAVVSGSGGAGACPCPTMFSDLSSNSYDYAQALDYCRTLNEGGHGDWRLPDFSEVTKLRGQGGINILNLNGDYTWATSSSGSGHLGYRMSDLAVGSGNAGTLRKVRCVR